MKRAVSIALGLLAAGAGGASNAQAQGADPKLCDPSSYNLDAVAAAPASHRVLFEDAHVRALEIVLPPLAVEPVHIHALPSVITGDSGGAAGARFIYTTYRYEAGKFEVESSDEITPTPGERTVWTAPEGPHAIANIGPVPVRFMRIEIKPEACAR
jgi:hypothetical protein